MPRLMVRLFAALGLFAAAPFAFGGAHAGSMSTLDAEMRTQWQAVGHLQGPGYRMKRGCTGTLIAPDLVVTAAHCVMGAIWNNPNQYFRTGWYKGSYSAHREYASVKVHPLYTTSKDVKRLKYDMAVIQLKTAIPRDQVAPVPLVPVSAGSPARALLLGYENESPYDLRGHLDCPARRISGTDLQSYLCEVVGGTSGGAVITPVQGEGALSAVIVARQGPDGHALAASVNQWLRAQVYQATEREAGQVAPD